MLNRCRPGKPVLPQAANHVNQKIFSPVIVNDNNATSTPTVDELASSIISNKNFTGDDFAGEVQPSSTGGDAAATTNTTPAEIKVNEAPLNHAQVMPEYPGGIEALKKFMLKTLRQPEDLQPGEKIIVRASFVVNANGAIGQVHINNGGRPDLNKEVERVINKMPLWKPGLQNGHAVAVYFNLPVTFLNDQED